MADEYWVEQLETWQANGTFGRLKKAMEGHVPVKVKRSDGSISDGRINAYAGFGGRVIEVAIAGTGLFKAVRTDVFLEQNPQFGPSLIHLTPPEDLP